MSGKLQNRAGTTSPIVAFDFALANLAASQTDTAVPVVGGVANAHAAVKAGSIVGYSITLSAAFSDGVVSVALQSGGSDAVEVSIDTAETTEFVGTFEYGDYPFAAGDTLSVTYTSDGDATPTTSDMIVRVYVMFEDFDV
jgi:hypothetical protein